MTSFIFVGNGKEDPIFVTLFGYQFELNGGPVQVDERSAKKLALNSHFAEANINLAITSSSLPDDKHELEKLARDRFGVELDKRKTVANLQKQVQELIDGNQDGG